MVARTYRVARLPAADHHGTPISPDVHSRGAQVAPSAKSRNPAAWQRVAQAQVDAMPLRADARRGVQAVIWQLARISRSDCTVMPTWERLVDGTGLSRSTVCRSLRRLRAAGLLTVLETGSTPATRGRWSRLSGDGNRAAKYALTQPTSTPPSTPTAPPARSELSDPPGVTSEGGLSFLRAGARKQHCHGLDSNPWSMTATTSTRTDELAAATALGQVSLDLHRLSSRWVRSKIRPWLRDGWTVADLVWAVDHDPDGTPRTWTGLAANPAPWLTARLAAWIDHPAPSAVAADKQLRQRQEQAAQRLSAGLPVLTQHSYNQAHQDALTARLEAQGPQISDPATARAGAAACRAALTDARARRAA